MSRWSLFAVVICGAALPARPSAADETPPLFELRHGDRVVLLGSALIERAEAFGYLETALTSRYPRRSILFRNLGWSGDTVFGDARAGFDDAAKGFQRLVEHVNALEPTVLVIGYGTNESFAGPDGVADFKSGLERLLDAIGGSKPRIIFLAPLKHEDLGRPLPDPQEHNRLLEPYCAVLREAASHRAGVYLDLFNELGAGPDAAIPGPLTDNGMHLSGYGYWRAAATIERLLGLPDEPWQVELTRDGQVVSATGTTLSNVSASPSAIRFRAEDTRLPTPPAPVDGPYQGQLPGRGRVLSVKGLSGGKYQLQIDQRHVITATAEEWSAGVPIGAGPEFDQVEQLRQAIRQKNALYFYRWRPQNETYLFGFRKYEQGQNAREIPLFDPLVTAAEGTIAGLRLPTPHEYALVPAE